MISKEHRCRLYIIIPPYILHREMKTVMTLRLGQYSNYTDRVFVVPAVNKYKVRTSAEDAKTVTTNGTEVAIFVFVEMWDDQFSPGFISQLARSCVDTYSDFRAIIVKPCSFRLPKDKYSKKQIAGYMEARHSDMKFAKFISDAQDEWQNWSSHNRNDLDVRSIVLTNMYKRKGQAKPTNNAVVAARSRRIHQTLITHNLFEHVMSIEHQHIPLLGPNRWLFYTGKHLHLTTRSTNKNMHDLIRNLDTCFAFDDYKIKQNETHGQPLWLTYDTLSSRVTAASLKQAMRHKLPTKLTNTEAQQLWSLFERDDKHIRFDYKSALGLSDIIASTLRAAPKS